MPSLAVHALLVASVLAAPLGCPADPATVTVPAGTVVPILVDHDLRAASPDEPATRAVTEMEVAQDVIVDGHVVAKRGDVVDGRLTTKRTATQRLLVPVTSETIVLDVDQILTFCDARLRVRFERTADGSSKNPLDANARLHGPAFVRGTILAATTDGARDVCARPSTARPDPLPSGALRSP